MNVLLIEGDAKLSQSIQSVLTGAEMTVKSTDTGHRGAELAKTRIFDLVVLNLGLPNMNGLDLIQVLRGEKVTAPILAFSKGASTDVKTMALDMGADAHQEMPCHPELFAAYAKATIRRARKVSSTELIEVGSLSIDRDRCLVFIAGKEVQFTAHEYKLLVLLAENKGGVVGKYDISRSLHDHDDYFGNSNIPEVFIFRLREKIRLAGGGEPIDTVRGEGYTMHDPAKESATC